MKKFLIGKKIGMTQLLDSDGKVCPATVLTLEPCEVIDFKTSEQHGYDAVVVGYGDIKEKHLNKPQEGFFKRLKKSPKKYVKEFRVDDVDSYREKNTLDGSDFEANETVSVRSKSIGKGFAGTVKRHGFGRGPMTHGSKNHRMPGSIGGGTYPGRVMKGKRMGGHMGDEFVTIRNLSVLEVNNEENYIIIKGAIPGKKNNIVTVFN